MALSACKSGRQGPLVGRWKLSSVTTSPAGLEAQAPPTGTIYTFRADSTLVTSGGASVQRYELQRLPEGMFLVVGDSPKLQYRVVAVTPAELGLQERRGESLLNLKLEFQP